MLVTPSKGSLTSFPRSAQTIAETQHRLYVTNGSVWASLTT